MKFPIVRNCFRCERVLTGSQSGQATQDFDEPPGDAVVFSTPGNYGSRVFDSRYAKLEISICDACLTTMRKYVLYYQEEYTRVVTKDVKPWEPDKDE